MEKVFNKLVRDKIVQKIENNGEKAFTRILDDKEYILELYKKLNEECLEVVNSKDNTLEELADVLEVIMSIAKYHNISFDDVIKMCDEKRSKRGGFDEKIFLIKTE